MTYVNVYRRALSMTFFALILMAAFQAHNTGMRLVPVLSGSMQPHYKVGSLVVTEKTTSRQITKGEVIVFRPPTPYTTPHERPVMHRVVKVAEVDGKKAVWTKGDANPTPDSWVLSTENSSVHHAVKVIPYAGILVGAIANGSHMVVAFIIIGLLMLAYAVRRLASRNAVTCRCAPADTTCIPPITAAQLDIHRVSERIGSSTSAGT